MNINIQDTPDALELERFPYKAITPMQMAAWQKEHIERWAKKKAVEHNKKYGQKEKQ